MSAPRSITLGARRAWPLLGSLAWLSGCGGGGGAIPPVEPATPGSGAAALPTAPSAPRAAERSLEVELVPDAQSLAVRVRVRATGDPVELATWHAGVEHFDALHLDALSARDAEGALTATVTGDDLSFDRPPHGKVELSYVVDVEARATETNPSLFVDAFRFEASGRDVIVTPRAFERRPVPVTLTIDARALEPPAGVATSFGVGARRQLEISGAALARVAMLAGKDLGHAVFDGPEGHDEAAWLGYTAFDPRIVAAEVAGFRTASAELFGDERRVPLTLLVASTPRPSGQFDVERRPASVLLHVGAGDAYSGAVRISVFHQVLRQWLGGTLALAGSDGGDSAPWFDGGFSRFYARELAFRFGAVTAEDRRDELEHLVGLARFPEALSPEAAGLVRGALYATWLDRRLRDVSGKSSSLDPVMRALVKRALAVEGPLPLDAALDAFSDALGEDVRPSFAAQVERGELGALAANTLGPCFRPRERTYERFDLGYETRTTGDGVELSRLDGDGPAERAGARVGDELVRARYVDGDPGQPVELVVRRGGQERTLRYRPVGATARGPGFERVPGVPDARCGEGG